MYKTILSLLLVVFCTKATTLGYGSLEEIYSEEETPLKENHNLYHLEDFMLELAEKESCNTWDTISRRYKYVGKYQFGEAARKTVGAPKFTWREFERDPMIWPESQQDSAVIKLMKVNHSYLSNHFKVEGDHLIVDHMERMFQAHDAKWYVEGTPVKLTWSGIYAASHLVGPKNVRRFINSNGWINAKDGNGVTTFDYLKKFENEWSYPVMALRPF